MILTNQQIDNNSGMFNPSITLNKSLKINKYSYPDPNSYYILSEAGKNYTVVENSSILLVNINKGYYEQNFYINDIKTTVLSMSNNMFGKTKPIDGLAKVALELAISKMGKKEPTLHNRY